MTEVFGRNPMYWHRLECSLGRFSLVGTTVIEAEHLPRHLVADEKHTTLAGEMVYLTVTASGGCCLGIVLVEAARNDESYSVRPSFLMPYLAGRTEYVQAPLFSASSPSRSGP